MKKNLQNGRSMIEMLGVLSIIGILTVGGFSLVSKTVAENKTNKVIDEISDLARHTRIVFREYIYDKKPSNGSNMTEYLKNAGAYPVGLLSYSGSGSTAKFTDDEDVDMTVKLLEKNSIKYYVLVVSNLSQEFCMAITSGQWGTAASNGFSGIAFKENDVVGGKIDLGDAAKDCADGTSIYLAFR
jgi:type II secretory pathway pseudopilin PulG